MRIATSTIFEAGVRQLGTLQTDMSKLQLQMSTNKRVVTPSDDPIAASRALEVTQSQSLNTPVHQPRRTGRRPPRAGTPATPARAGTGLSHELSWDGPGTWWEDLGLPPSPLEDSTESSMMLTLMYGLGGIKCHSWG